MKAEVKILNDMIETLKEKGWTQGMMWDKDGRCCLSGAVAKAQSFVPATVDAFHNITFAIHDEIGEPIVGASGSWHSIVKWNDAPGRTEDDVVEMLTTVKEKFL